MTAATQEAYNLFHEGMITLAEIEENGVGIDVALLESTIIAIEKKVATIQKELKADPIYDLWRRRFGERTKLSSRPQLGEILFSPKDRGGLGYDVVGYTSKDKIRVDEEALEDIDLPFVQKYVYAAKLRDKILNTYLHGIKREVVDGRAHCNYNLNTTVTYRSSSDNFNFQNLPIRDPEMGALIRSLFIPMPGNSIVEIDFSQIEVRIANAYHKDPTMTTYLKDPTKDLHRDMARQIFCLDASEFQDGAGKATRGLAKGNFVFAQFYGDYYVNCARNIWHKARRERLKTKDGVPLIKHLRRKGIVDLGRCDPDHRPEPGTFEHHMKAVEDHFWKKRFPVYTQWKRDWYDAYLKKGYFDSLTGFHYEGIFSRNDVINYAVQGSAFHGMLWSLNRLRNLIHKRGMQAMLIGQIHDSIITEVPTAEIPEFVRMARKVMTGALVRHYNWINVPIEVEVEVAPEGRPWNEKRKMAA